MAGGPDPELFRMFVERSVYVYALVDASTRIRYVSPQVEQLFGYPPDELVGTVALDLLEPEYREPVLASLTDLVQHPGAGVPIVAGVRHRNGSTVFVEIGGNTELDNPAVGGIMVRMRPYDDQRLLDQYLEALATSSVPVEQTLEPLVGSIKAQHLTSEVALAHDWDGRSFTTVVDTGLPAVLAGIADPPGARCLPWLEAQRTGLPCIVAELADLDPGLRPAAEAAGLEACWAYPVPVPPDGAQLASLIVWRGIPGGPMLGHQAAVAHSVRLAALGFERRHSEDLLRHAALHDTLTGIPNRFHFFQALEQLLQAGPDQRSAVLFADLDGFKEINDTHGHSVGDEVLAIVAERLQAGIRPGDLVARVGGDEFAVLCTGLPTDEDVIRLADRLIAAVGQPIRIGRVTTRVGVSIGVAFHDPAGRGEPRLVDAADGALLQAKQAGKNRWIVAQPA